MAFGAGYPWMGVECFYALTPLMMHVNPILQKYPDPYSTVIVKWLPLQWNTTSYIQKRLYMITNYNPLISHQFDYPQAFYLYLYHQDIPPPHCP